MNDEDKNIILVRLSESATTRKEAIKPLKVEVLAENINLFITQIQTILEKTPPEIGHFKFSEFSITAEISAKGALVIMGTGVETEGKGGLTFKFERK